MSSIQRPASPSQGGRLRLVGRTGHRFMTTELNFTIERTRFDEDYRPAENTRITTNFANLARGENREENLRNTLTMINNRFNALAHWDNPKGDRYSVKLDIISAEMNIDGDSNSLGIPSSKC